MHDTPGVPTIIPAPKSFDEPDSTPATTAEKRQPGRPKLESSYDKTIQLRLSDEQLKRVTTLAKQAGCTRSAIIRAGLEQVQLIRAAPHPEQHQLYRELVRLASNLNQLLKLAHMNKAVVEETQQVVKQVRLLLAQMTNKSS